MNVYHTLQATAHRVPNHLALVDEWGTLTFSQLFAQTEDLKEKLLKEGLGKGLALGIMTANNRYFVMAIYAGVATGTVVMPISNQLKPQEVQLAVEEAGLHVVLSDSPKYPIGLEKKDIGTSLFLSRTKRDVAQLTADFVPHAAFMRFTSGTTGKAKGVVLSHQSVLERIEAANEGLGLNESDRVVWVLPMAYHFIVSICLYIRYGVGIIVNNHFLADSIVDSIRQHGGTMLYAAPMHIKLLASANRDMSLPTLRKVISTTTEIPVAVCDAFKKKYQMPVSQAFGIIEVGLPILNLKRSSEFPEAVGYAQSSYQVAMLDAQFNPLPNGGEGLLGIKGPGMFDAYLNPPTHRLEVLKNGWFVTGDIAIAQPDGLILIKGRAKNMINVAGNKAFPAEIEAVINAYEGVANSRVYSHKHPLLGEVVAAEIQPLEGATIDKESLISHCRKMLSAFKVPQVVNMVDSIEMTSSGKVKRV
jgi:long-chain acyl-CoA synthetase